MSKYILPLLSIAIAVGFFATSLNHYFHNLIIVRAASSALLTPTASQFRPIIEIEGRCVQIYYDHPLSSKDRLGRAYAIMLANLIGHFPRLQTVLSPIELYKKGDLDRCLANFYIATTYENKLPQDFYTDLTTTKSRFAWIGDSFWLLGENLPKTFGVKFRSYEKEDPTRPDASGNPSFFRDVLYKGETFPKLSEKTKVGWDAEPLISRVTLEKSSGSKILASIRQSYTRETIPWAIQRNQFFLFTEIPFSFVHEGDRYFVFADLLFDVLNEKPNRTKPIAIVRFEDIHAKIEPKFLSDALAIAKQDGVKPILSLIPIYRDPLNNQESLFSSDVPLSEASDLLEVIQKYQTDGGVLGWHGVTHQYGEKANPESGRSGEDFEFWDEIHQRPIEGETTLSVLARLHQGADALAQGELKPRVWITPHYKASGLDTMVFAHVFDWTIGRQVYFDFSRPEGKWANSIDHFKFDSAPEHMFEQIYPYEIYGDFYGQHIIPEDLGNVQLTAGAIGARARSVDEILADAKRMSVLRDVWASFFYHPFLLELEDPSSTEEVRREVDLRHLLKGIHDLGYDFIDLNAFVKDRNGITRPEWKDAGQSRF